MMRDQLINTIPNEQSRFRQRYFSFTNYIVAGRVELDDINIAFLTEAVEVIKAVSD